VFLHSFYCLPTVPDGGLSSSEQSGSCNGQTYNVRFDFSAYTSAGLTIAVYTSCLCAEPASSILFSLRRKWETVWAATVQSFHFSRWCRALPYCKMNNYFFSPGDLESNICKLIKNERFLGEFRSTKKSKTKDKTRKRLSHSPLCGAFALFCDKRIHRVETTARYEIYVNFSYILALFFSMGWKAGKVPPLQSVTVVILERCTSILTPVLHPLGSLASPWCPAMPGLTLGLCLALPLPMLGPGTWPHSTVAAPHPRLPHCWASSRSALCSTGTVIDRRAAKIPCR